MGNLSSVYVYVCACFAYCWTKKRNGLLCVSFDYYCTVSSTPFYWRRPLSSPPRKVGIMTARENDNKRTPNQHTRDFTVKRKRRITWKWNRTPFLRFGEAVKSFPDCRFGFPSAGGDVTLLKFHDHPLDQQKRTVWCHVTLLDWTFEFFRLLTGWMCHFLCSLAILATAIDWGRSRDVCWLDTGRWWGSRGGKKSSGPGVVTWGLSVNVNDGGYRQRKWGRLSTGSILGIRRRPRRKLNSADNKHADIFLVDSKIQNVRHRCSWK